MEPLACLSVLVGIALLSLLLLTGYGGLVILFWRRHTRGLAWAVALSGAVVSVMCLALALPGSDLFYDFRFAALVGLVLRSTSIGFGVGAAMAIFIATPVLFFRQRSAPTTRESEPSVLSQHDSEPP